MQDVSKALAAGHFIKIVADLKKLLVAWILE